MFDPQFLDHDETVISVKVSDTHTVVLEQGGHPDFEAAKAGEFGTPAPYVPAADDGPVAQVVTVSRLQAKAALLKMGLLDQVEQLVGSLDAMTQLAWREAVSYRSDSPMILALAPFLTWPSGEALSSADIEQLFALAETIEV